MPEKEIQAKDIRVRKKGVSVNVYGVDGERKKDITLPEVFSSAVRMDLIKKDVLSIRAGRRQAYGPSPTSGMRHSVEWWGKGRGVSRVTRLKGQARGAQSPCTVGGRPCNPPRPERIWTLKMNHKERLRARASALGAVREKELVSKRGHRFNAELTLPLVIDDDFEKVDATQDVIEVLQKVGVYDDVMRAWTGKHQRAGVGKLRGRRFRSPKSLLIVVSRKDGIEKGARNLAGVDIVTPGQLNTELLAPGGDPGRLSVFTESAIEELRRWKHG
jgi:large subunit ribosomal protein L4e